MKMGEKIAWEEIAFKIFVGLDKFLEDLSLSRGKTIRKCGAFEWLNGETQTSTFW